MSKKGKKVKEQKEQKPVGQTPLLEKVLSVLDSEIRYWSRGHKGKTGLLFMSDEEDRRKYSVAALKRAKGKILKEVSVRQPSK